MLFNLIKISIRNLLKRRFYSILNLLGLAFSITFSFLLWLYTQDQLSYDKHFENGGRIFRVNADFNMNGKRDIYSNAPRPVGPTFKTEFPEVTEAARIRGYGGLNIHMGKFVDDKRVIKTKEIFIADSTFLNIFKFEFIHGNPKKALSEPNSVVITESMAHKIFGEKEAFGQTVRLVGRSEKSLKVTGIIKDSNCNTHLPIEALISWSTFPYEHEMTQWYGAHVYTYILLEKNQHISSVEDKIPDFYDKYMKETFEPSNGTASFIFQPIKDIYLDSEYVWEPYAHGSHRNISTLQLIIVFLIAFACINYVNLATARSVERAGEVGIRKTLGSSKAQLVGQFLTESTLLAVFAGVVSIFMASLFLPFFNDLSSLDIDAGTIIDSTHLFYVLGLSILIGLVSGLYPALNLSSQEILKVLKGKSFTNSKGELLREVLVTAQYVIAAVLISSVLIVSNQTKYIKNKDIGFERENLIVLEVPSDTSVSKNLELFSQKLKNHSNILGTSRSRYSLDAEANQFTPTLENPDGSKFDMGSDLILIDYDFVETIGLTMLSGRNFDKKRSATDNYGMIINETAMKKFGWQDKPLEGKLVTGQKDEEGNDIKYKVIGVVKDFNLGVSYQTVNPLIIFGNTASDGKNLFIKMGNGVALETISDIKKSWNESFPLLNLEYRFLDQSLERLYEKEDKFLKLLSLFSIIIIIIASLGIIGLISFTTELKRKEIAIRKVHGAPLKSIVNILTKKFITLLSIANIIAVPAGYYLISLWLENFPHRIDVSLWPYAISLLISLVFTVLAIAYHIIKAAAVNPVHYLRYE